MFELNRLYNMDCMMAMKEIPDRYFQLAIVDPPYGGGGCENTSDVGLQGGHNTKWGSRRRGRFGERFDKYYISDSNGRNLGEEIQDRGFP